MRIRVVRHTNAPNKKIFVVGRIDLEGEEEVDATAGLRPLLRCTWDIADGGTILRFFWLDQAAEDNPDYNGIPLAIEEHFRRARTYIEKGDLRTPMIRLFEGPYLGFLAREAGGLYWIPRGETQEITDAITTTLQTLSSELNGLQITAFLILDNRNTRQGVYNSLTGATESTLDRLEADITDLSNKSDRTERAVRIRIDRVEHMQKRLRHYRAILSEYDTTLDEMYSNRVNDLRLSVTNLLSLP